MAQLYAVAKPGAHLLVFTDWRQMPTTTDAVQVGGWVWRNVATWWKPGCRMQRGGFSASAEFVVWGTKGPWSRDNPYAPQNVISCGMTKNKMHIAQKPIDVLRWLVPFAKPDGLIVDPFVGSGTTLLAAKEAGRKAVGIDHDERYCEMAAKRVLAFNIDMDSWAL